MINDFIYGIPPDDVINIQKEEFIKTKLRHMFVKLEHKRYPKYMTNIDLEVIQRIMLIKKPEETFNDFILELLDLYCKSKKEDLT